jgi:hypothetical protein
MGLKKNAFHQKGRRVPSKIHIIDKKKEKTDPRNPS